MGLEVATFISGLNTNNPVGAADPKSEGDDHLRLIKTTLLNTFPNITGVMNVSHTELNNLVGVTGKTGSGNIVLSNAPTFTGLISGLAGSGAALTSLNASNISSGTLADARLSSNVPLLNAENNYTGLTTRFTNAGGPLIRLTDSDAAADEGVLELRSVSGVFVIAARNDNELLPVNLIRGERTGTDWDSLALTADSITANGSEIITTAGSGLTKTGNALAINDTVIRTTGNQSIGGIKTFTSAPIFSAGINGDSVFNNSLEVGEDFITSGILSSANAGNNVPITNASIFRYTGVTADLTGFAGGVDGRRLTVINRGSGTLIFKIENASSTASNRLIAPTSTNNKNLLQDMSAEFLYDGSTARWQLIGVFADAA